MKIFTPLFAGFFLLTSSSFAEVFTYEVTAKKLDSSRNNLSPNTGGSSFSFTQKDIENLPQGQMTPLNQVLLRAPGVTQNSFGQIHVRGDHGNLQYRINGIIIPEGISGFGQSFDTHFAHSADLLTGALPAQYGYRTAGVVDIKTKSGAFENGGRSEIMVGGNNTLGLNQQVSGAKDRLNYYLSATYLQNNRGIESPTAAKNPIHDNTQQDKLFGYFSYLLDASSRLNFIVANSDNRFQVPNNPNADQSQNKTLTGYGNSFNVRNLNENQKESNSYAIASLQGVSSSEIDYQISAFTRYSTLKFRSDFVGNLIINGVASNIDRNSLMNGIQADFSYKLNEDHKLRYGTYATDESVRNSRDSFVFNTDSSGNQTSNDPRLISDNNNKHVQFYSLYVQDEFKPLQKLTLNFGLRYDKSVSYSNEQQLSPRAGATYDLTTKTKLHAGFSRYFTPAPAQLVQSAVLEKFKNTSNAPENFTNGKPRAERSSYYDIGITHKLTPNLNIGVDGYYRKVHNLLDEGQFGNALIYSSFNYQQAEIYGAAFTTDYKKDNFATYFNLATQNARAKNIVSAQYLFGQDELDHAAGNSVHLDHMQTYSASAGASYLLQKTNYSGDVIYGSGLRTGTSNQNTMPAYFQTNLSAARDFSIVGINKINLRFSVLNLLDQTYKLHDGSGIGVAATQYGPRRTLYLTVSKNF